MTPSEIDYVYSNNSGIKVKIAVVISDDGIVCTCGVSGDITEEIAMQKAKAKTNGVLVYEGFVSGTVPEVKRMEGKNDH